MCCTPTGNMTVHWFIFPVVTRGTATKQNPIGPKSIFPIGRNTKRKASETDEGTTVIWNEVRNKSIYCTFFSHCFKKARKFLHGNCTSFSLDEISGRCTLLIIDVVLEISSRHWNLSAATLLVATRVIFFLLFLCRRETKLMKKHFFFFMNTGFFNSIFSTILMKWWRRCWSGPPASLRLLVHLLSAKQSGVR